MRFFFMNKNTKLLEFKLQSRGSNKKSAISEISIKNYENLPTLFKSKLENVSSDKLEEALEPLLLSYIESRQITSQNNKISEIYGFNELIQDKTKEIHELYNNNLTAFLNLTYGFSEDDSYWFIAKYKYSFDPVKYSYENIKNLEEVRMYNNEVRKLTLLDRLCTSGLIIDTFELVALFLSKIWNY